MTKLIPILSGRCLVVEIPKQDFIKAKMQTLVDMRTVWSGKLNFKNNGKWETITLPPGNWRIIGMLSEVRDAELADVTGFYYNKYNDRYVEMPTSAMRATPIGDIENAILAEGYLLESPPTPKCGCFGPAEEGACPACDEWVESQSRVLDRSRCLLLGRER